MRNSSATRGSDSPERTRQAWITVWVAQGFGIGRVPFAPGTFGSLLGLAWFAVLMAIPSAWFYVLGCLAGLVASIVIGGRAERALGKKDPGSIVLDEIAAIPVCFAAWVVALFLDRGAWPRIADFFQHGAWVWSAGVLLAFRVFDILKPWPLRQSQRLPGGWGVTVDDFGAALYVNACAAVALFWLS